MSNGRRAAIHAAIDEALAGIAPPDADGPDDTFDTRALDAAVTDALNRLGVASSVVTVAAAAARRAVEGTDARIAEEREKRRILKAEVRVLQAEGRMFRERARLRGEALIQLRRYTHDLAARVDSLEAERNRGILGWLRRKGIIT